MTRSISPDTPSATDIELLESARAGDEAALVALLERHQAQVYRFSMKMCQDPEDAKDVVQETLLAMARGVRGFRGASSLSTWIYTLARNFCIKKRRRSKFAPNQAALQSTDLGSGPEIFDPKKSPDEALADKQVEQALAQAIRSLDPAYREVLLLRDVEGLTAPEVAEVLGISAQAVKSRLHRARVAIRDGLAPVFQTPGDLPATPPQDTCPDIATLFSQYLEDEINADTCKAMELHLTGCPRCQSACNSLKRTLTLCRASGTETRVPPSVQTAVKQALGSFLRQGA